MSVANPLPLSHVDHLWAGVFPLPLTPIEATFLLADDRAGYPMMVDIRLEFDGAWTGMFSPPRQRPRCAIRCFAASWGATRG